MYKRGYWLAVVLCYSYHHTTFQWCRNGGGAGGPCPPPLPPISVNPIATGGGQIIPPIFSPSGITAVLARSATLQRCTFLKYHSYFLPQILCHKIFCCCLLKYIEFMSYFIMKSKVHKVNMITTSESILLLCTMYVSTSLLSNYRP